MLTRTEIGMIADKVAEKLYDKTDELLTAKQCADWLGITVDALYGRCQRGQIPFKRKHGALYFSKNEVTEYYLND